MVQAGERAAADLILVADDEIMIRSLVGEILEDAGYRTLAAADGEEALRLAREHRPAAIVLDLMMPGMDGYATLTHLRGHPVTAATPVIVLTGRSDPAFRVLSRGVGAAAHVTKPFSSVELLDTVQGALARRRP
jgi:CheY-like chemotaxis protein